MSEVMLARRRKVVRETVDTYLLSSTIDNGYPVFSATSSFVGNTSPEIFIRQTALSEHRRGNYIYYVLLSLRTSLVTSVSYIIILNEGIIIIIMYNINIILYFVEYINNNN